MGHIKKINAAKRQKVKGEMNNKTTEMMKKNGIEGAFWLPLLTTFGDWSAINALFYEIENGNALLPKYKKMQWYRNLSAIFGKDAVSIANVWEEDIYKEGRETKDKEYAQKIAQWVKMTFGEFSWVVAVEGRGTYFLTKEEGAKLLQGKEWKGTNAKEIQ